GLVAGGAAVVGDERNPGLGSGFRVGEAAASFGIAVGVTDVAEVVGRGEEPAVANFETRLGAGEASDGRPKQLADASRVALQIGRPVGIFEVEPVGNERRGLGRVPAAQAFGPGQAGS
ncbi:MAG TPA: hypothetical protein VIR57_18360, partial [Chloroflexota bacterium]